jgi:hypothetical protein
MILLFAMMELILGACGVLLAVIGFEFYGPWVGFFAAFTAGICLALMADIMLRRGE